MNKIFYLFKFSYLKILLNINPILIYLVATW
jgi:hypothetical protein